MANWRESYKKKVVSAADAVKKIKSGDRVVVSHACGEPKVLLDAMVANAAAYKRVEIVHMVAMGKAEYCKPEYKDNFFHNTIFVGGTTRKAIEEGRGDFIPCYFHQFPGLFRSEILHPNVALVNVSPPDEHGYCSYGVSCDYTKPAAEAADLIIAQVNKAMPRLLGDAFIHVNDIDYIVETDDPLIELGPPQITDVEKGIGKNCASLIKDGDTLQLGIGAIPDAVLLFLKEKKHLGIHSEMISDGVMELVEAGVVDCSKKSLHPGRIVVTFIMGTRKLYDFIDDNPMMQMMPVDYVNDPAVIGRNDNLVSINSCIEVDLMGQVVSEMIGPRQYSGVGGQVDFVRGANLSKGGRAIIAMPSTAGNGKSKIVANIATGAAVTTSRCDVDYVVTEYGVAALKGRTLRQRARELIKIAHPSAQDELKAEFEKRFQEKY